MTTMIRRNAPRDGSKRVKRTFYPRSQHAEIITRTARNEQLPEAYLYLTAFEIGLGVMLRGEAPIVPPPEAKHA